VSQDGGVGAGEAVQVTAIDGLTLTVTRSPQRP
jgi:membrane protein implicated in regulation of membrane protease activity